MRKIKSVYCKGNNSLAPNHKLKVRVWYLINSWKIFLCCEYFSLCLSFPVSHFGFLMAKRFDCNFNNFPSAVGRLCHRTAYSWWALNVAFCISRVMQQGFLFCCICAPVRGLLLWRAFYLILAMIFIFWKKRFFQCTNVTEKETYLISPLKQF